MKQTAVEWLVEQMEKQCVNVLTDEEIDKAKEMEKSQNKYFYDHGFYTGRCTDINKHESFEYFFNSYKSKQ
jgi:hypothetical protein